MTWSKQLFAYKYTPLFRRGLHIFGNKYLRSSNNPFSLAAIIPHPGGIYLKHLLVLYFGGQRFWKKKLKVIYMILTWLDTHVLFHFRYSLCKSGDLYLNVCSCCLIYVFCFITLFCSSFRISYAFTKGFTIFTPGSHFLHKITVNQHIKWRLH